MDLGQRLRSVRKRRGFNQRELADISGVSLSLIRKLEQGDRSTARLETVRKLAVALRVRTSTLQDGPADAEHADPDTADLWEPVRRALSGPSCAPSDEDDHPTNAGVQAGYEALMPMIDAHRYRDIAALLPPLLRDAEMLGDHEGRAIRARLLSLTGWMLTQNRQFDIAAMTLDQAIDTAPERGIAVGAVNVAVWSHLRQGDLTAARDLAVRWADDIEPRFSRATASQLALWGRLWLYVANVEVRDNSPGTTDDALRLARSAAVRIGREVLYDPNPNRLFGPITVAQITGECAVIAEQPTTTLDIAERLPVAVLSPTAAGRLRHRLDVANAHTQLRQFGEAVQTLREVRSAAPEWLVQQRYARDILGRIVRERRTLTPEMRDLADSVRLDY
ncbi:helix-turn-helix transcriptional regulator [Nocardia cyriacigeorgica]|uniref:Helix-turn-helix transcriptional regulator n=2 Tax=Nocardia cyriacigeorgica TaxID=135487 RepID=A0A6P1CH10_9NOCA|nr:helix-turn-helix transcriptional regulator [Nocardia cyriacigeorgica]MBF6288925.1 helix-turn-helix transcriptional regulator [Nocardia cyriacigeorgica]NEW31891.1 helix-turn-helix transcriptional regulator [Nocardia cyriacigeorgica]